jgi:hypothetical protein
MAQNRHYSPRIDRFLVTCLYHEARCRRMPMTRLVDGLLKEALAGSPGWKQAEEDRSNRENTRRDRPAG